MTTTSTSRAICRRRSEVATATTSSTAAASRRVLGWRRSDIVDLHRALGRRRMSHSTVSPTTARRRKATTSAATSKRIYTGGRTDVIVASNAVPHLITTGAGNDTIDTKNGVKDTIDCGPGKDTLRGDPIDVRSNCEKFNALASAYACYHGGAIPTHHVDQARVAGGHCGPDRSSAPVCAGRSRGRAGVRSLAADERDAGAPLERDQPHHRVVPALIGSWLPKGAQARSRRRGCCRRTSPKTVAKQPGVTRADAFVQARETLKGKDVNVLGIVPGGLGSPVAHSGRLPSAGGEAIVDSTLGYHVGDHFSLGTLPVTVVGTTTRTTYYFGQADRVPSDRRRAEELPRRPAVRDRHRRTRARSRARPPARSCSTPGRRSHRPQSSAEVRHANGRDLQFVAVDHGGGHRRHDGVPHRAGAVPRYRRVQVDGYRQPCPVQRHGGAGPCARPRRVRGGRRDLVAARAAHAVRGRDAGPCLHPGCRRRRSSSV